MKNHIARINTVASHVGAFVLLASWLAPSASATAYVMPGTTRFDASVYDDFDGPDSMIIPAVKDSSYYCRGVPFSGIDLLAFSSTISGPSGTNPTVVFRGTADGNTSSASAFSFIANVTGNHTMSISTDSAGSGSASAARALLECFETTLYGNFNTVTIANPVNFLEVKNISTVSTDIVVVVRKFDTTELTRLSKTLAAGERVDIGIHDLANSGNTFGSVTVSHNGPLGGIVANVSKYTFAGGVLAITATEGLHERVQK